MAGPLSDWHDHPDFGGDPSALTAEGVFRAAAVLDPPAATEPHVAYQTRPEDWIVEKLGVRRETLRWTLNDGYQTHAWDGTPEPLVAILDALARRERMVGVESGNGTGKSFLFACVILWFVACWRDARAFTFAPKEDQLSLYIWAEISRLWPRFVRLFPEARLNHLEILIEPGNDIWGAWGYPVSVREGEQVSAKASGMHGEHMLIVTEETQGMDARVVAANEATCTDEHNLRVALGNPGFPADELHRFCTQPGAVAVRISAEDHPNVVTGRRVVPGATSRTKVEEAKRKHGRDSRHYATRIRGLCPEGGGPALYELSRGIHLKRRDELQLPDLDSYDVTLFGWLDWGHAHPWSFGQYACWWDRSLGRERVVKLDTLTGHRMRTDRIAAAIRDQFPDVDRWDYLGAGSDIKQRHEGRTPSHVVVRTIQEQLAEAGLFFSMFVDDGAFTRAPRLNNFRDWIAWQHRGAMDPRSLQPTHAEPAFVLLDTPGNRACLEQLERITTDPKKPENPLKRDANPETGEGGDDMFDETMNALASRPYAAEPEAPEVDAHRNPGFQGPAGKRRLRRRREEEDDDQDSPFQFANPYGGANDEEDDAGDWWRTS